MLLKRLLSAAEVQLYKLTVCLSIQPHKALFLIFESKEKWATYLVSFFFSTQTFFVLECRWFQHLWLGCKSEAFVALVFGGPWKMSRKIPARKPFGKRFWLAVFLYASRVEELPSFVKYCLKRKKNIHCQAVCDAYVWQASAEG